MTCFTYQSATAEIGFSGNKTLFFSFPTLIFHTASSWFLRILLFYVYSDWHAARTGCISVICERNTNNGSGWRLCRFGESKPSAYSDFLPPTPQRISPSTTHPRRPGTCVTYNWFINNVNRCFWSSLASCQLASVLVYCHRPADCIPLNVRWHKMEEGDFFFFFILKRMKINCTFSESCMMFMLIDS